MLSTLSLMRLLVAVPVSGLAAAVTASSCKGFDPSDLTYREVGARNTLVRSSDFHRMASGLMLIPAGLARLAGEGWQPHLLLA